MTDTFPIYHDPEDLGQFARLGTEQGWRWDLERRNELLADGLETYHRWRENWTGYDWEPPAEIDPRQWFDTENQGSMGSCQGCSLASCVELQHYLTTGEEVQISKAFAYLASQERDGLLGRDSGSTLAGGSWAARRGLPLESRFPYSTNYSSVYSRYRQQKDEILRDDSQLYKLEGAVPLATEEDMYRWVSSYSGFVQIGILWGLPDAWEITRYTASGGGHAVVFAGYLKVSNWPNGRGWLLHNSWGKGWGRDGWGLVHPSVIGQMLQARYSDFVGRSISKSPKPTHALGDL